MESIAQLAAALAAAQGEFTNPPKTRTAKVRSKKGEESSYAYTYADLADVIDAVRPVMSKHGLAITHILQPAPAGGYILLSRLLHKSGEFMDSVYPVPDGLGAQDFGGWLTYMRRYSTCNMLFIAGETDDDGATAQDATAGRKVDHEAVKAALEAARKQTSAPINATSAYDGRKLAPGEDPLPPAKPESKPAPKNDTSLVNPKLVAQLTAQGLTVDDFYNYYVTEGHMPEDVKPCDVEADYLDELFDPANWAAAVTKMKANKKGTK